MKKYILFAIFGFFAMNSVGQNQLVNDKDSAEIIFNETDHNFGVAKYQSDVSFEFIFKNTGKTPLIIKHVQSSCGCTTPTYSTEPIPPKGTGKILVKYDSERPGPFIKNIKVFSNAKNSTVDLTIRGEIKKD
jgi:hypothetical protein